MAHYRHEDVATAPQGWRVRTVTRGEHRIRIACAPGPRTAGGCRTVAVLHPAGERNPCNVRYLLPNPSELLILGANPHRPTRPNPTVIGARIAQMKEAGASGSDVGRMLSKVTANQNSPQRHRETRSERMARLWPGETERMKDYPRQLAAFLRLKREYQEKTGKKNPTQDEMLEWHARRVGAPWNTGTIYDSIRARSRVTIVTPHGQRRSGRAVMLGPAGWVLNLGGAHGTPGIASPENTIAVSGRRNPKRDYGPSKLKVKTPRGETQFETQFSGKTFEFTDPATGQKKTVEVWEETPRSRKARGLPPEENPNPLRYEIAEIDALDRLTILSRGHTQAVAREKLKALRAAYGGAGLRFVMAKEGTYSGRNPRPYRKLVRSDAQTTASGGIRRSLISAHATRIAAEDAAEKLKGPGLVAERWKTGFDYTPAEITELRARPWGVWRAYQNPGDAATAFRDRYGYESPTKSPKRGVRFQKLPDGRAQILDRSTGEVLKTYKSYRDAHARRIIAQDIRRFAHMLANPSEAAVGEATDLYKEFHGRAPKEILELQEPEQHGVVLTGLGQLVALTIDPAGANGNGNGNGNGHHKWIGLDFTGEAIQLAANAKGSQLYLVGGNQSIPAADLARFGTDTSKDVVQLGEVRGGYKNWRAVKSSGKLGPDDSPAITYRSAKSFTGHKQADYWHEFAEEGGKPPIAFYDKARKRIMLMGGSYRVEAPGIIN